MIRIPPKSTSDGSIPRIIPHLQMEMQPYIQSAEACSIIRFALYIYYAVWVKRRRRRKRRKRKRRRKKETQIRCRISQKSGFFLFFKHLLHVIICYHGMKEKWFCFHVVHWPFIFGHGWLLSNQFFKTCQNSFLSMLVLFALHDMMPFARAFTTMQQAMHTHMYVSCLWQWKLKTPNKKSVWSIIFMKSLHAKAAKSTFHNCACFYWF